MATTAIVPEVLAVNTRSADLPDAGMTGNGIVATTPSDGWVIAAATNAGNDMILKFLADATGDTVTILAGDRPPSQRSGLGNLSIVLAVSDVRFVVIEKSRFLQDDGTILATCTDAGTSCMALQLPKAQ